MISLSVFMYLILYAEAYRRYTGGDALILHPHPHKGKNEGFILLALRGLWETVLIAIPV